MRREEGVCCCACVMCEKERGGGVQIVENLVGPSFLCLHPETSDAWNFRHRKLPGHLRRYMPESGERGKSKM